MKWITREKIKVGLVTWLGRHGEDGSFNSILKKYSLSDPALICWERLSGQPIRARAGGIPPAKDRAGSQRVLAGLA